MTSPGEEPPRLLNVVVTAYNNGRYIRKCLESIIKQKETFNSFKITIGYDEGSKDNTLSICEEYEKMFNFVEIKKYPNNWVGVIRNRVAEETKEKYITFVDGDDSLPKDALRKMVKEAEENNTECVIGLLQCHYLSGKKRTMPSYLEKGNSRICNTFIHPVLYTTRAYNCDYFCLEDIKTHEDRPCGYFITKFSPNHVLIKENLYNYYVRPNSSIRNPRARIDMLGDIMSLYYYMKRFKYIFSEEEWELIMEDLTWCAVSTVLFTYKIENKEERKRITKSHLAAIEMMFPNWRIHPTVMRIRTRPIIKEFARMLVEGDIDEEFVNFTDGYKMKIIDLVSERYALGGWLEVLISKIRRK